MYVFSAVLFLAALFLEVVNVSFPSAKDPEKFDRILVLGNSLLLPILYTKPDIFLDGTFRCVPSQFHQCFIVMAFDRATNSYVPVLYILMTGKTQEMYWMALDYVIILSKWTLEPDWVTCDFELAISNAAKHQFPDADQNGCFFHWKDGNGRYMKGCKIEKEQISYAMKPGVLDILTIIPKNEIPKKGIAYVKFLIDSQFPDMTVSDREKWAEYWKYFENFWCHSRFINMYNINSETRDKRDLRNRTNNALERYNRHLNYIFPTPHPNLPAFVTTLKAESTRIVTKLENIRHGRVPWPTYEPLNLPEVPTDYYEYNENAHTTAV